MFLLSSCEKSDPENSLSGQKPSRASVCTLALLHQQHRIEFRVFSDDVGMLFSLTFYLQSRLHDTIILMYWRCESTRRYECLYINSECVRLRSMRQCAGCVCRGGKACQWPARKKIAEGRAKWKRKKNRIKNDIVDEKEICVRSHDAIHIWMGWKGCIRHNHMKGGGATIFRLGRY